jgi:uncharacterized repeat protein (TIGR01451 family)
MSKMRKIERGGLAATLLLAVAFTPQAWAVTGTNYDTQVDNSATLDYDVGTSAQTQVNSTTATFYVDVMVDFSLAEADGASVQVSPGGTAATEFLLTNNTNGTMYFTFAATNDSADTAFNGGTNEGAVPMDMASFVILTDTDNDCSTSGDQATVTATDITLAEGASIGICVEADAPGAGEDDGDIAVVVLTATATGSSGTALIDGDALDGSGAGTYAGFGTPNVDTLIVLAEDPNGTVANGTEDDTGTGGNGDGDGRAEDTNAYILASADLTVTKTHTVISDPTSQDIYEIPGSVLEYTITIENDGTADAVDIFLVDAIAVASLTFVDDSPTSQPFTAAQTAADGVCDGAGGALTTYLETAGDASVDNGADDVLYDDTNDELEFFANGTGFTVAAGDCAELKFRVTID